MVKRTDKILRSWGAATLCAAVAASSGCKKDSSDSGKAPADNGEQAGKTATEPVQPGTPGEAGTEPAGPDAADRPEIKLVKPGNEPRQVLRYKLATGHKEKVAIAITIAMEMDMPGAPSTPVHMPPMMMKMDLEVGESSGADKAQYKFTVTSADVGESPDADPMVTQALKTSMANVVGMKGSAMVDTRGFNDVGTLEMPAGLDPQMKQLMEQTRQSMDQLSSPLPEEPVGIGAVWEMSQVVDQAGVKVKQRTEFELVEISGDRGKLKAKITQTAAPQKLLSQGIEVEIASLESSGEGEIQFDLANLVPNSSVIDMKTSTVVRQAGAEVKMKMNMTVDIRQEK